MRYACQVLLLTILIILFIVLPFKQGELNMNTAVRGLPEDLIPKYRKLAAHLVQKTGKVVSMNSLYVKALKEYLKKPGNKKIVD